MADPASLISAPVAADNNTVALWALGILVLSVAALVRWAAANHKRCEERGDKLEQKFDASQTFTQTRLVRVIEDNTASNNEVAGAIRDMRRDLRDRDLLPDDETREVRAKDR